MSESSGRSPHPLCPKCHLPIKEDEISISHQGKTYHRRCAPAPASAGDKDDPYRDTTPIGI
ncbi:MAG TPA: hypothetical protein VN515_06905 [Terriglobales bacterium]|nr:hypothetical protein [Terriglobales bacterium]